MWSPLNAFHFHNSLLFGEMIKTILPHNINDSQRKNH